MTEVPEPIVCKRCNTDITAPGGTTRPHLCPAEYKGDSKKPVPQEKLPTDMTKVEAEQELKTAYRSAIRSYLKEHYMDQFTEDPESIKHLPSALAEMLNEAATKKRSREKKTSEFALITVNCKPETDEKKQKQLVERIIECAEKAACKKIVYRCVLAYEVGENGHPHVHMAVQFYEPKAKSTLRNLWAKTFESVLAPGSYKSDRILNIAICKDLEAFEGATAYVQGTKADASKMEALQVNTIPFRRKYKLADFMIYEEGDLVGEYMVE